MNTCEWDPETKDAAYTGAGCTNEATVCVGAQGNWHLCDECAALPEFKRFRKRTPLTKRQPPTREAE